MTHHDYRRSHPTLATPGNYTAWSAGALALAALSLMLGASIEFVSLLLSTVSLSLVLIVLRGERQRNAALLAFLDQLGREVGVPGPRRGR